MNIFVLHETDHKQCAEWHNNKHVVKMIVETAQMLSTAHAEHNSKYAWPNGCYKPTHINHPCNIWVRKTSENYKWLLKLLFCLLEEYEHRYGKKHKTWERVQYLIYNPVPVGQITPFAQAMPDCYKHNDAVTAYRQYYIGDKQHIAQWKNRSVPDWYICRNKP